MQQPLILVSPAFSGPYGINALLLPQSAAPIVEGPWVPLAGAKVATLELFGSMSTLGVDLYATNNPNPVNGYTITVGGSITDGDTVTATFANPNLGVLLNITVPVVGGDTTDIVGAKLAAAINANANLQGAGIAASDLSSVVTITFPSLYPGLGAAGSPSFANYTVVTASKSSGASETVAVATLTTGIKVGSTLAAFALTAITVLPSYIKARLQTLTGSGANVTAALNASI